MVVYISSFSIAILISYLLRNIMQNSFRFKKGSKRIKKTEILVFAYILWFVMGLRDSTVGSDTANYSNIFVEIATKGPFNHMMFKRAPVYTIYNTIIGLFSHSHQWVVMCNSAVIILCIAYVIYKESDDAIGSWFCYVTLHYYFFGMNAARQSMAIAMSMVTFSLLREKKIKMAVLVEIMAVLTHSSAAVSIALFPIMTIKNKKRTYYIFLFVLVAFVAFFDKIMILFVRLFPEYSSYMNRAFVESLGNAAGGRSITAIYLIIVIALSIILYRKKKIVDREKFFQLIYMVTVAIIPMLLMRSSNISYRIEMYFLEYSILLVPFVFTKIKNKSNRIFVSIMGYAVLLIPYFMKIPAYLPYHFFFE